MIYFITNKSEQYKLSIPNHLFKDITILSEEGAYELFIKLIGKSNILAVDIEATGLDPYRTTPLLYGIGTKSIQFMFDWTIDIKPYIQYLVRQKKIVLGHNLKYDIKLIKVNTGIILTRLYDTMICEQRLWMKSGYRFAYAAVVERYLNKIVVKSVRDEFIGVNIDTFKISPAHLYYLRGDLDDLFEVRKKQQDYIKRFDMAFLIYGIEFPLISLVAEAELEGFKLDVDKWKTRIKKDKDIRLETEIALDTEVLRLRDYVSVNQLYKTFDPIHSLGGKFTRKRIHNEIYDTFLEGKTTTTLDLFGENMTHQQLTGLKKKVIVAPNNINYSAKKDIVYIFACLNQPMPTPIGTYMIPTLTDKGKLSKPVDTFTVKEDFLLKCILDNPNSIMNDFIKLKIKHSKLEKAITTYGESFISKLNIITGKLHTIFRQTDADTGRFQSGGGTMEPDKPNFQNIPADNAYRECFITDDGYSLLTPDYSGAELVVMASHAQDFKLIELSKGDMHSHMATACWKNIFGYRAQIILNRIKNNPALKLIPKIVEEYTKNVDLFRTFIVTKETGGGKYRKDFKPMTFGTIYGMYAKKAAGTLNIVVEEGSIVIKTIESEIPNTFEMVKKASNDAKKQGYVILNERTKSRAWFPNLIKALKGEISEKTHFKEMSAEMSAARNIRIQGTQADFVKEATVVIGKHLRNINLDFNTQSLIISWIHDEIVAKIPTYLDGNSDEWKQYIVNNPHFTIYSSTTKKQYQDLSTLIVDLMKVVANRYLENVTIDVEYHIGKTWHK